MMRKLTTVLATILTTALLAGGCSPLGLETEETAMEPEEKPVAPSKTTGATTVESSGGTPPQGAILIDDDLYMVPVSRSAEGCQQYSAWSATKATLTVIYYRRADGSFTMLKEEAACS